MKRAIALGALASILVASPASAQSVRAPYLQQGTPDAMTIAWRTAAATSSVVCVGASPDALTRRVEGAAGIDHAVRVDALAPGTTYYYAVSDACPPASPGSATQRFTTSPRTGTRTPFRMWVAGDSGTGGARQIAVFDSMLAATRDRAPDLFLHAGDMAYSTGTTSEFDTRFFEIYASLLERTPCWPTLGNHEGASSDSGTESGPYYEAYVLPVDGSAGGLPSGTEAYYAFDYANVHFVVLDSHDSSRVVGGPMLSWLESDLASTDQEWIVALWHHPPYTDGSHDSDTEGQLIDMRENALPILEAAGVDLVLTGHSHIYERSFLVHGAYDTPTTAAGHIVDPGDGRVDGDGAYRAIGDGALYVVAGHGGAGVSGTGAHPLMYSTELENGSCIVDVAGAALTLRNVRWDGVETDHVTLVKEDGIVVLAPVGGEVFLAGSTVDVTWTSTGTSGEVSVDYSLDDGRTWVSIADRIADDGHVAWTTPRMRTTRGRVRVTDAADPGVTAASPGTFELSAEAEVDAIPFGSVWAYWDDGTEPAATWTTELGTWASGPAQLGYGEGDEATVLADQDPNIATYYFRRGVTIDGEATSAHLRVLYDDGFAVFVNGTEVLSQNVGDGLAHDVYASATSADNALAEGDFDPSLLVSGENVIAVVVKQGGTTSSDLSFDLSLSVGVRVPLDPDPVDAGVSADAGAQQDGGSIVRDDAGTGGATGGCGCHAPSSDGAPLPLSIALVAIGLVLVRRRRPSWIALCVALTAVGCGEPPVPPATPAERARVQVTLYTTRWCPACAGARGWLRARGIPFDDRDVESSPAHAARLSTLNPARTVPTIEVDGRVLVGFVEEELRRAVDSAAHAR